MEVVTGEIERREIGIRCFHSFRIFVLVQFSPHRQAGSGRGCGDELDDRLKTSQRLSEPVDRQEREKAVFDLIPFAGAGRQMADRDGQSEGISESLEFYFP